MIDRPMSRDTLHNLRHNTVIADRQTDDASSSLTNVYNTGKLATISQAAHFIATRSRRRFVHTAVTLYSTGDLRPCNVRPPWLCLRPCNARPGCASVRHNHSHVLVLSTRLWLCTPLGTSDHAMPARPGCASVRHNKSTSADGSTINSMFTDSTTQIIKSSHWK